MNTISFRNMACAVGIVFSATLIGIAEQAAAEPISCDMIPDVPYETHQDIEPICEQMTITAQRPSPRTSPPQRNRTVEFSHVRSEAVAWLVQRSQPEQLDTTS